MPLYSYLCHECDENWKVFHSMNEKEEKCPKCSSEEIKKLLTRPILNLNIDPKSVDESKQRVERFIEESRQALKEQLTEARKDFQK